MKLQLDLFRPRDTVYKIDVPASKSMLNRALLLAAFSGKDVLLRCGALSEDTRAMLDCLHTLGIASEQTENCLKICGKLSPPDRRAVLDVRNAGTAARFLTVVLAFFGGEYELHAGEQMAKRPMDILCLLEENGVSFEWLKTKGAFPFKMRSSGLRGKTRFSCDTDVSTQYASALLLAAALGETPVDIALTGGRTDGGYIAMTQKLIGTFGGNCARDGNEIAVFPIDRRRAPDFYSVEADLSGACYFFAMALLFRLRALVRGAALSGSQSDEGFLKLLAEKGVIFTQTEEGLLADARSVEGFTGFDADFCDFSDQTLTAAAIAPFATTVSRLRGVAHIAKQECDRIGAIVQNLNALGVRAESDGENITIYPAPVRGGSVRTFGDHRVAMSFALTALKTGNITIDEPDCCKKTFENYFEILQALT